MFNLIKRKQKGGSTQSDSGIVVAGDVKDRLKLGNLKSIILNNRKRILTVLVIILVFVGLPAYYLLVISYDHEYWRGLVGLGPSISFKVGDTAYAKKDVQAMAKYPIAVSNLKKDQAAKQIFDMEKAKAAAAAAGIKPTQAELDSGLSHAKYALSNDKGYNDFKNLVAFYNAIPLAENRQPIGEFKGYAFIYYFGYHLDKGPEYTPPGYRDAKLVAADRDYAQAKAKAGRDALIASKIKPDDLLKQIISDPRLGYMNQANTNRSVHFGTTPGKSWALDIYYPGIIDFIKTQTNSGVSDIQTGKIATDSSRPNQLEDDFFFFTLLESAKSSKNVPVQYQANLKSLKAKYYGI